MEHVKLTIEVFLIAALHWIYERIAFFISIPLALWITSHWSYSVLTFLGKMLLGVGIGLLTAFAVTVYKVMVEPKVVKWLKNKKEKSAQKKEEENQTEQD